MRFWGSPSGTQWTLVWLSSSQSHDLAGALHILPGSHGGVGSYCLELRAGRGAQERQFKVQKSYQPLTVTVLPAASSSARPPWRMSSGSCSSSSTCYSGLWPSFWLSEDLMLNPFSKNTLKSVMMERGHGKWRRGNKSSSSSARRSVSELEGD